VCSSDLFAAEGDPRLLTSIGDDCAVLRRDDGMVDLVTLDTLVDGIHFDLTWHPPELLGRKSVSVNVSDIAAMGGRPCYALLSAALPLSCHPDWIEGFLEGFRAALRHYGVVLIGGDTVAAAQMVFSVCVIGEAPENRVCYRAGARAEDLVFIGGPLGEAGAGLALCRKGWQSETGAERLVKAHLDPEAQVKLGIALAESGLVHAMMDISDGLATDLAHLCAESGVGAEIVAEKIPLSPELQAAADRLALSALDLALHAGEDYCLLFTAAPEQAESVRKIASSVSAQVSLVGRIVRGGGVRLLRADEKIDITYQGYDHFRKK